MQKILIADSTLRDGSHGIRHQFTTKQISAYAKRAERAKIPVIVIGHGNGLGASSIHLGLSKTPDRQMLKAARRVVRQTRLATFVLPGFSTIEDMNMAISEGVDVFQVASHCTEATVTKQYIQYAKKKGKEVYGVLMMIHMVDSQQLIKQVDLMTSYGVDGVFLMDSAGASLPKDIDEKIEKIGVCRTYRGFHPHNNLGLAVANGIEAVKAGATMIDGTTRGLGAGAGNCPLEVLVPVLHKMGYETGVDEEKLFDCAEYIRSQFPPQDLTPLSITSGLNGVFSGFKPHVEKASKKYKVSGHQIFKELGKQKVVAGQEDAVLKVAKELKAHPMEALQ
jgi:4-hydroxy 2-oxovalerate aldolase